MHILGKFHRDLLPPVGKTPKGGDFSKGILPKMAETFRLRIYNKLPTYCSCVFLSKPPGR